MKYFDITFTRYGFARIKAEDENEAFDKAKGYSKEDVTWSDDFEVTDAQETYEEIKENNYHNKQPETAEKCYKMNEQILDIIYAVRNYKKWTTSNNMVEPRDDFDWFKETETYYFCFTKLPEGMDKNRQDFERILQIPEETIERWNQMEPEELANEYWK